MKRKTAGRVHHERECSLCHGLMTEKRPVFLLQQPSGSIMGPYHSGCAAKLAMLYAKSDERAKKAVEGAEVFGYSRPEENMPW